MDRGPVQFGLLGVQAMAKLYDPLKKSFVDPARAIHRKIPPDNRTTQGHRRKRRQFSGEISAQFQLVPRNRLRPVRWWSETTPNLERIGCCDKQKWRNTLAPDKAVDMLRIQTISCRTQIKNGGEA